jgi:hypothetical protein
MPKALVVFESMWGNTEQVARAIASGLQTSCEVDVTEVGSAPSEVGPDVNVVVAGGPTHAFSMSRESTRADALNKGADHGHRDKGLRDWLDALPGGHHPQQVATFDTRVAQMRHLPGSAAKAAAKTAHRHGYPRASRVESFYVVDMAGPLIDGEMERAAAWGREIASGLDRRVS